MLPAVAANRSVRFGNSRKCLVVTSSGRRRRAVLVDIPERATGGWASELARGCCAEASGGAVAVGTCATLAPEGKLRVRNAKPINQHARRLGVVIGASRLPHASGAKVL